MLFDFFDRFNTCFYRLVNSCFSNFRLLQCKVIVKRWIAPLSGGLLHYHCELVVSPLPIRTYQCE